MNIVIIGAGNVGYYLTRSLLNAGNHEIRLIDKDRSRCRLAADRLEVPVVHGDGTLISGLEKVGAAKADIVVAVTGQDEDNFVAAQLAKEVFHVKTTISKANNPKNVDTMKSIASDIVVSSVNTLANIIEQEVDAASMRLVTRLNMGDAVLVEYVVKPDDIIASRQIMDVKWPKETLVVAVVREGRSIIPSGDTTLLPGDDVMISTKESNKKHLSKLFSKR